MGAAAAADSACCVISGRLVLPRANALLPVTVNAIPANVLRYLGDMDTLAFTWRCIGISRFCIRHQHHSKGAAQPLDKGPSQLMHSAFGRLSVPQKDLKRPSVPQASRLHRSCRRPSTGTRGWSRAMRLRFRHEQCEVLRQHRAEDGCNQHHDEDPVEHAAVEQRLAGGIEGPCTRRGWPRASPRPAQR